MLRLLSKAVPRGFLGTGSGDSPGALNVGIKHWIQLWSRPLTWREPRYIVVGGYSVTGSTSSTHCLILIICLPAFQLTVNKAAGVFSVTPNLGNIVAVVGNDDLGI